MKLPYSEQVFLPLEERHLKKKGDSVFFYSEYLWVRNIVMSSYVTHYQSETKHCDIYPSLLAKSHINYKKDPGIGNQIVK